MPVVLRRATSRRLTRLDKFVYIRHDIFISKSMQHIIKRAQVIEHAVLLEQTKRFIALHMVRALISFEAEYLEMRRIAHYTIPPSIDKEIPEDH